jgi:hypothetical protein
LKRTGNLCFNNCTIAGIYNSSVGLILERQPLFLKSESTKLEGKALSRLAKHPVEDRHHLPPPE